MKFLKKIFLIFILSIVACLGGLSSFADIKINNVSIDSSNKFIFLSTSGTPSTDLSINSLSLKSPNRIFFDINGAILTQPNETWYLKNSNISQIRVSQFTTNPNVVRVVFYIDKNFDPKGISIVNVKGNFLFKFENPELKQTDFLPAYRETRSEKYDFMEKMVYIPASKVEQTTTKSDLTEINANTVQKAFSAVTAAATKPLDKELQSTTPKSFSWDKIFKVRTRYYISRVDIKRGNILLLGSGNISVEKPLILESPKRIVYDFPNSVLAQRFRNVEVQLSEKETLKIGQFEPSKVRLVITTETPEAYTPIFSADMQGMLLAHRDRLSGIKLYEKPSKTVSYNSIAETPMTDVVQINHELPVVHSVKRNGNEVEIIVYNATDFQQELFKQAIAVLKSTSVKVEKNDVAGIKYTFIPHSSKSEVETFIREDGTQVRIRIKNQKPEFKPAIHQRDNTSRGSGLIVIDPGHGGLDGGAIRAGINEKDINIDIAKMIVQILRKHGYKVNMTRWDDSTLSLQERVDFSDENKAAIFVSIHTNSSVRDEPEGIETHWWKDDSQELAQIVHESFTDKVKAVDRGLVQSKFYVINHTKAPSVLVEVGFISNDKERNELVTEKRKQKTAEGIANGIIKYMKGEAKK